MKMYLIATFVIVCLFTANGFGKKYNCYEEHNGGNSINNSSSKNTDVNFEIDLSKKQGEIKNLVSNINMWDYHSSWIGNAPSKDTAYFKKNLPFVKYVQFMTATGGNEQRDLFIHPLDRNIKDDYDFSSLVNACRNAVKQGLLPVIITGNVPLKYSTNPVISESFGVNINAPDNYDEYYSYIKALGDTLVKYFGLDEVKKWRWGVLTEYENKDWFKTDNDTEKTKQNYFKLYDYTVAALQNSISPDIYVGAHSMTVANGFWDEQDFIEHCAKGTNFKTGKTGTRLCYLSCSFYDTKPGKFAKRTLVETISIVRDKAKQMGFGNLQYGIDEGKILSGVDDKPLVPRIVGETYQAGYDARLYKIMLDDDIDYFSAWGYTTSGIWKGVPTVSLHTAKLFYKMAGSSRIAVEKIQKNKEPETEVDAFAGYNDVKGKLYIMGYNFKNSLDYKDKKRIALDINVSGKFAGDVKVTQWIVDDNSNFFNKWLADCKKSGISDTSFSWSKDSAIMDNTLFYNNDNLSILKKNENNYLKLSKLKSVSIAAVVKNDKLNISALIPANAVIFYEIESACDN